MNCKFVDRPNAIVLFSCSATTGEIKYYTVLIEINELSV